MNSKRSLAALAAGSLGVFGIVGVSPAYAGVDDVITLDANTGDNYSVFLADTFDLDVDLDELSVNPTLYDNARLAVSGLDGADSFDVAPLYASDVKFVDADGLDNDNGKCEAQLNVTVVAASDGGTSSQTVVLYSEDTDFANHGDDTGDNDADDGDCEAQLAAAGNITKDDFTGTVTYASTTGTVFFPLSGDFKLDVPNSDIVADEGRSATDPYPTSQTLRFTPSDADDSFGGGTVSMNVQAWIETSGAQLVDANRTSPQKLTFHDPEDVSSIVRIERFSDDDDNQHLINADQAVVTGSLRFSQTMNLDQINYDQFGYSINSSDDTHDEDHADNENLTIDKQDGFAEHDDFGRTMWEITMDNNLNETETVRVVLRHDEDDTTPRDYSSPGFQIPDNTADTDADEMVASVVSTTDATQTGSTVNLREGVNSFTYTGQITDGGVVKQSANVPVLVEVTAGGFLSSGSEIIVSGATQRITEETQSVFTTGLTNSKGKFSVTITSNTAADPEAYEVDFYILLADGTWSQADGNTDGEGDLDSTYDTAAADELASATTVLAGTSPVMNFTIEDQFDQPIAANSDGDAYSVSLKAPDTDDLELYQVAEDGTASFSFDNWLAEGESTVLSAVVFTGSSTAPTNTSVDSVITLYAGIDVTAVNVVEELNAAIDITFDDFITGKASLTNIAPSNGDAETYTGTIIDENGAGIPGVAVNVAAEGFQFLYDSEYYLDEVDVITDAAGQFSVDYWTHIVSKDHVITVTAGGATGTTELEAELPNSYSAEHLVLSWDLEGPFVYNTTYAVTASLKDKWGNGVAGAQLKFDGFAAAEFNGEATVTRTARADGSATAYLRSLKDVSGLSSVGVSLVDGNTDGQAGNEITNVTSTFSDNEDTAYDESSWSDSIEEEITFLTSAPAAADAKVNAGSFKGYVAVYAKGYEGQRLSAKIGNDWVVVPALASSFERIVDFTGAGVDIAVRIYIDRVLMDTINLTTK